MAPIASSVKETSSESVLHTSADFLQNILKRSLVNIAKRANKAAQAAKCSLTFCDYKPPTHPANNATLPVMGKCADDGFHQFGCDASGKPLTHEIGTRSVNSILDELWKRGGKKAADIKCQFKLCQDTVDPVKWEGKNSSRPYGTCPDDGKYYQFGCDLSGKPYKKMELASRSLPSFLSHESEPISGTQQQSFEVKLSAYQIVFMILILLVIMYFLYRQARRYLDKCKEAKGEEEVDLEKMVFVVDDEEEYYSDFI